MDIVRIGKTEKYHLIIINMSDLDLTAVTFKLTSLVLLGRDQKIADSVDCTFT